MVDFPNQPPKADPTLHIETVWHQTIEVPVTVAFDRITGDGVVVFCGAFHPITKRAIAEPLEIDAATFRAINDIYERETHRKLCTPQLVRDAIALAIVREQVELLVKEELAKRGI